MDENNGTANDEAGAIEAEQIEDFTDQESGGDDEVNPDTGKLYTEAEIEAIRKDTAEKVRKATERKLQRRYEREMARQPQPEPQDVELNPDNIPKKDGETDAQWIARIAKLQLQHERLQAERQQKAVRAQAEMQSFQDNVEDFYERANALPEFDEDEFRAYVSDYGLSDEWAETIVTLDGGERVAAYYAANPKEFERLSKLSKYQQVTDIGRVQAKLEKQIKQAADPMAQVKGGNVNNRRLDQMTQKEIDAMPLKEFEARLKKEGGGRWL